MHWALRAQSIIAFGLTWIAIVLVKTKNSKHNIQFKLFDFGVIKTAPFWLLIFSSSRVYLGMSSFYTLANFTTSLGYTEREGSYVSATIQIGSCVGRPLMGLLSDKYGGATVASVGYFIAGILLSNVDSCKKSCYRDHICSYNGGNNGCYLRNDCTSSGQVVWDSENECCLFPDMGFMGVAGLFSPVIGVKLTKAVVWGIDPTRYVNCSILQGVFIVCSNFIDNTRLRQCS